MRSWASHRTTRARRLLLGTLAPASLLLLLGCTAHAPMTATTSAAPVTRQAPEHSALVDRHESGGGDARRVEQALLRVEGAYAAGQASLLAGDDEAAFDSFDEALEVILRSDLDLDAHPDFRDRAEQVIASINELAVTAAGADDGEEVPGLPHLDDETDAVAVTEMWRSGDLRIPMVSHPSVDAMIRFYTGRAKERLELGLARYGKYAPTVARIFEEEGVPGELAWLALVESNYNPQAYSRARARGLWQFISATGRRYGLKQDFWVDERSDFEKATRSAARYLRDLHGMFGDWHLALASYNAGEGKIGRAIKATGHRDFWRIRETRYIRRETKDYVPAYLAVLTVVHDPAKYGIAFKPSPSLDWEVASVSSCTDLGVIAQCAGTSLEALQDLNPELRRGTTPGGEVPYALRLPRGTRGQFEEKYASLPAEQRLTWHRHVVSRGDTVSRIAQIYGTSPGAVMAANRLTNASRLATGQALLIPAGPAVGSVPDEVLASRAPRGFEDPVTSATRSSSSRRISYRVRPGDTLGKIANRHGTSIAKLSDWNNLRNANRIHVGQRLTIYTRGGSSPSSGGSRASTTRSSTRSAYHVVRRGDTLSAIARKHGLTVTQLRRMNGLGSSNIIRPGQKLRIVSTRASLDDLVPSPSTEPIARTASASGGSSPIAD